MSDSITSPNPVGGQGLPSELTPAKQQPKAANPREALQEGASQLQSMAADYTPTSLPPPPGMPKIPAPPTFEMSNPLQAFGSFAVTLAALGSLITRRPLVTALNSAAAAMKAAQNNDLLSYKYNVEQWKTMSDYAFKLQDAQQKQYNEILGSAKLNDQEKMNEMRIVASANQDYGRLATLDQGDMRIAVEHNDRMASLAERASIAQQNLAMHAETIALARERLNTDPSRLAAGMYLNAHKDDKPAEGQSGDDFQKQQAYDFQSFLKGIKTGDELKMTTISDAQKNLQEAQGYLQESMSGGGENVVGVGGTYNRLKDWLQSWTTGNADQSSAAYNFQAIISQLKFEIPHLIAGRATAEQQSELNNWISGLGPLTTPKEAMDSLDKVNTLLGDILKNNPSATAMGLNKPPNKTNAAGRSRPSSAPEGFPGVWGSDGKYWVLMNPNEPDASKRQYRPFQ